MANAISQYQSAFDYITSLGIDKPIHIGETGWATIASSSYGATGSKAADEYKENRVYLLATIFPFGTSRDRSRDTEAREEESSHLRGGERGVENIRDVSRRIRDRRHRSLQRTQRTQQGQ